MAINALQSAASALSAFNTALDVVANNLANINTVGFKADRTNFQDLLYIEKSQPGVENANGDQRPIGLYVGLGVKVSGTQKSFQQGAPGPSRKRVHRSRQLMLAVHRHDARADLHAHTHRAAARALLRVSYGAIRFVSPLRLVRFHALASQSRGCRC